LTGFHPGVNLASCIWQYQRLDEKPIATFINENDIPRIASWGMDHVRLPVDYPVLEDDAHPFVYRPTGLAHIANCPARVPGLETFLSQQPQHRQSLEKFLTTRMDREHLYLIANLQTALDFQRQTRLPLSCGEYGAIDVAPLASRLNWHRDFTGLLGENNIGRDIWSFREMNFWQVNLRGEEVNRELIEIVS
jgi:hypothetical protein